ncbi:MAG: hypothetical protein HQ472_07120 [Ignavibacteria bacterium]|nr:hypothetical protein [Ignavibacteria bacterium]
MIQTRKPRRRIEIYFILYLVALVLLLPDAVPVGGDSNGISLTELRLDMQPERVRLQTKLVTDSLGGSRLVKMDSMNIIRYYGNVNDLKFSARIEEVETGQILTIEPGESSTQMFQIVPEPDRQAVVFKWHPNVQDLVPRTFRVTITGSAVPVDANGDKKGANPMSGLRISGSAQFVLATVVEREGRQTYVNNITIIDTGRRSTDAFGNGQQNFGQFWIDVARDRIVTLATKEWVNRISVGGADPARDLAGMPVVKVTGDVVGEIERYVDEKQRAIIVKGKAPRSGQLTVEVTAKRRDGQTSTTSFVVASEPLNTIQMPDAMFPGIEYAIDVKLPSLENVYAVLKDGDREITSARSGVVKYKPLLRDTGRTLTLERYVDDQRVGMVFTVVVKSFPSPEIRDVRVVGGGDKKKVLVKFFGDKNLDRPSLFVLDGNAKTPKKLFGNRREADPNERPTVSWLEEFEVDRKDASRPFTFRIQAKDTRGFSSKVWTEE